MLQYFLLKYLSRVAYDWVFQPSVASNVLWTSVASWTGPQAPEILACRNIFFLSEKIFFQKYEIRVLKSANLGELNFERPYLLRRTCAAVCRKTATSCLLPNFLTHNAADYNIVLLIGLLYRFDLPANNRWHILQ